MSISRGGLNKEQMATKYFKFNTFVTSLFPFLNWVSKVNPSGLRSDTYAAITSAIFALPQGIAFAMIAGLPPEFGLYAAIVAPIVFALFGSSWHSVSGPTVATSIVVASILTEYAVPQSPHFIGFALILTFLAGFIQLILGLFRLGHIVNFISHTVILGFSTGAAILIMTSQLKSFLGLSIERQDNVFMTLSATLTKIGDTNVSVLFISVTTYIVAVLCKKYFKGLPYLLIAMLYGGVVAAIMKYFIHIDNFAMVGALPQGLPEITVPNISWFQIKDLFASAIALATLGLIQSVSISKTIAIKTGQSIDANQEFIGQGLTNIMCSFTSGFFSSSSFTRTGVNYTAGAKTPMSSIMASGLIVLVLVFASGVTALLPLASMSAIIMIIGYQLIDFGHIRKVLRTSRTETAVFIVTMLSTLFLSLEFAIYSGMFLSLVMYLQKTSTPKVFRMIVDESDPYHRLIVMPTGNTAANKKKIEKATQSNIRIFRIDGSIFFGSVEHIRKFLDVKRLPSKTHVIIFCESVNLIDISGAELLIFMRKILKKRGGDLYLTSLTPEVRKYLVRSPYWKHLGGRENVFDYQVEAVEYVTHLLEEEKLL